MVSDRVKLGCRGYNKSWLISAVYRAFNIPQTPKGERGAKPAPPSPSFSGTATYSTISSCLHKNLFKPLLSCKAILQTCPLVLLSGIAIYQSRLKYTKIEEEVLYKTMLSSSLSCLLATRQTLPEYSP